MELYNGIGNFLRINVVEKIMTREKMKIFEFDFEDHLTIYLDGNHLTELPSEIIELENLTSLDLDRNELTEFPSEILKLKNLTSLDLSRNKLTQLPPEIGDLKSVKILNLSRNQLTHQPKTHKSYKIIFEMTAR